MGYRFSAQFTSPSISFHSSVAKLINKDKSTLLLFSSLNNQWARQLQRNSKIECSGMLVRQRSLRLITQQTKRNWRSQTMKKKREVIEEKKATQLSISFNQFI